MVKLNNSWDGLLAEEFKKPYYLKLREFLKEEYKSHTVYPPMNDLFNALRYADYDDVKVVIMGQDPYHGEGQAHGLSFSVRKGVALPPSLKNIYKEIKDDLGIEPSKNGELTSWARQGVLLLNSVLTVRASLANSHRGKGWENLTDRVIELLNQREKPIVFMLWGANARQKKRLVTNPRHLVLEAAHPSPLSAFNGFFGCRHFSAANRFLEQNGQPPIDWSVE